MPARSKRAVRWPRPVRAVAGLFGRAAVEWWRDDSFQMAAALAFYTLFSLAPLVVIAVAVAGAVFGEEKASRALVEQIEALVGRAGGEAVRAVARNASASRGDAVATVLGLGAMVIGSTAVFAQLQTALNRIWDVKADPDAAGAGASGIVGLVRNRLLGFALAVGTGFVLVVSLVANAVLSAARDALSQWVPGWLGVWQALELTVSFLLVTAMFMVLYRTLPDVKLAWRDVLVGSLVSALLFSVGKFLIGLYLGTLSIGDVYGAAGSLAVLLVWVYYTALVSFFGAEFTQVYTRRYGSRIRAEDYATRGDRGKPAAETPPEDAAP